MARRRFGTASSVAPADKMGLADNRERKADARTGAETKRDLDMLDRKIRLPGHQPDAAALDGLALVSKSRIAGDDEQPADAGQRGDDLLDHAVGEILLLRVA